MSEVFFVSDTHFGHTNIIQYCDRPFKCVEDMDADIVKRWNQTVSKGDTVYHLGDVAFHNYERLAELNGTIKLVMGNHDHERRKKIAPFVNMLSGEIEYLSFDKDRRFALCHYPLERWRPGYRFHLHGHSHGSARHVQNRLDVGIDAHPHLARPLHMSEVIQLCITNIVLESIHG